MVHYRKRYEHIGKTSHACLIGLLITLAAGKGLYSFTELGKEAYLFAAGIGAFYTLLAVLNIAVKKSRRRREYQKYLSSNIHTVDSLDGIEFERYLRAHFVKQGYQVELTPPQKDYGVDLVISDGKDRIAVQAKRYNYEKGYKVTYKAVQEVAAGKAYYKCNKGLVITNSVFTRQAMELALCNDIILWDRSKLIEVFTMGSAPPRQQYMKEYFPGQKADACCRI